MNLIRNITAAMVIATTGSPAVSQVAAEFDGLYYPTGTTGWTCNPDHVGLDGGVLSIHDGNLDGVESRCELTNPQPASGDGIYFTAICSAEGESYPDGVTITKTTVGVEINRSGASVAWTACSTPSIDSAEPAMPQGQWGFADSVASIRSEGHMLELGCRPAGAASTIPTARIDACPLCWQGDNVDFGFSVDGDPTENFTFTKQSNAEGMTTDLYGSSAWFDGIIAELMSGRQLVVYEGNAVWGSFPLIGSSAAISMLRDECN